MSNVNVKLLVENIRSGTNIYTPLATDRECDTSR